MLAEAIAVAWVFWSAEALSGDCNPKKLQRENVSFWVMECRADTQIDFAVDFDGEEVVDYERDVEVGCLEKNSKMIAINVPIENSALFLKSEFDPLTGKQKRRVTLKASIKPPCSTVTAVKLEWTKKGAK